MKKTTLSLTHLVNHLRAVKCLPVVDAPPAGSFSASEPRFRIRVTALTLHVSASARRFGKETGAALILTTATTKLARSSAKRRGLPILRGDKNKGNRTPRYSRDVIELICDAAEDKFLLPNSPWDFANLVEFVNDDAHARKLVPAGKSISSEYIARILFEEVTPDPEIERMDPKLVAAAKSVAANRIVVAMPFERVEQDALHLPFVVSTPVGNSSNVWLVHAIDCSMGMPVGWHLVVGAPSESDGLRCVESTLFSKRAAFERLGLHIDLDIAGTPDLLVFDNGPETKGERMEGLSRIGINPKWLKARQPHKKPFIERLNRSLKEGLQTLRGCTRHGGKDGARDPVKEGDELLTLEQLERWIVRWYFEEWAHHELKRHRISDFHDLVKLGSTPAARWTRMQELGYPMSLSPRRTDFELCLYEHDEGTLNRKTGIATGTFNYRVGELNYLIAKYGETKVKFYRNPDDYRRIFVEDGEGKPWVSLWEEFVTDTTPAHSFERARELLDAEKAAAESSSAPTQFRKDVYAASVTKGTAKAKGKTKAEKNRSVADAHKDANAVKRAAKTPASPARMQDNAVAAGPRKFSFDNLPAMEAVDRNTGEAL